MRQFLTVTALALAIATPAFAQTVDPYATGLSSDLEIRDTQLWDRAVAAANADREHAAAPQQATQNAAVNSDSASDATAGRQAGTQGGISSFGPAGYGPGNSCPGTNAAGTNWQPGEYCLPGGRN